MEPRRVPPGERHIAGARLVTSTSGGYSVCLGDDYLGYVHASMGDQWRAYRRRVNELDDYLGRMGIEDAVRAILRAAGRCPR